jgi:hypothetical protein
MELCSTAKMLVTFKKDETSCPNLSTADVNAAIRDDKRLHDLLILLNDTSNPVPAVESANAQLALTDKNAADRYKQRFHDLKQKWQRGELTQNELIEALTVLSVDVRERHTKILKRIQQGIVEGNADAARRSPEVHALRDENRNALDPLETKVKRWNKEKSELEELMGIIFKEILANLPPREAQRLLSTTPAFGTPKLM